MLGEILGGSKSGLRDIQSFSVSHGQTKHPILVLFFPRIGKVRGLFLKLRLVVRWPFIPSLDILASYSLQRVLFVKLR